MNSREELPNRKSIRLKGYDYTQAGLYFITICCQDRICRFGEIVNGEMILNEYGKIANDEWIKLSERFPNFESDFFQIMPNHIHGIIALVGATFTVARNDNDNVDNGISRHDNCENGIFRHDIGTGVNPAPTVAQNNNRTGVNPVPTKTIGNIVGAYKSLVANGCLVIFKTKNEIMGKLWQRNYYEHVIRNEQSYQNISDYIINNPSKWTDDKFFMQ